ncbi:ParB/RepB/Spo0J family partition protein [Peptoniphilus equinus]|uniref:ParB/RepB/Spo0J family partition protein n=1 Tax=Peptoniphilus equinus TaxID=3016343 RepID=A0ABY7QT75_9FIRM|nr:ParB/RepB/Spo0J family partition protein [Peptoniphilus equinus]WBW49974.1 ParB/RepB/Spo0J family partition protein [Peptoniphilus equinus]
MKKGGLGRGLNHFLKDSNEVDKIIHGDEYASLGETVAIADIVPNPSQARKHFDDKALRELSESIKEHGIISPLILRSEGDGYEIIAGERRFRAAQMAGLTHVPALIKDLTEEEADKISLIENIQRVDLNPVEEAMGYKSVMAAYSLTQEELAKALGKSRQYIGNTVRLLKLPEEILDYLQEGRLSVSHGKLLLGIKDAKKQLTEARRIVKLGSTVHETEQTLPHKKNLNIFLEDARSSLEEVLGTKVDFKGQGKHRKIVIEYYSDEDLDRILCTIVGSDSHA